MGDAHGAPVGAVLTSVNTTGMTRIPAGTTDINAIIQAGPTNARYYLDPGVTYNVTTSIVPKSGIELWGQVAGGVASRIDGGTTVDRAVRGNVGAGAGTGFKFSNIVFDNFQASTLAAVTIGGSGSVLDHCEIRNTTGASPIGVWAGGPVTVRSNSVHGNGRYGMGGNGDGAQILNNEIYGNNAAHTYDGSFDAGGTKFAAGVSNWLIQGNNAHHNGGSGLWIDADGFRVIINDNLVEWNDFVGIDYEISWYGIISNNVVRHNAVYYLDPTHQTGSTGSLYYGADISVNTCRGVRIFGNTVVTDAGGNGIGVISAARGNTSHSFGSAASPQTDPTFGAVYMEAGTPYTATDISIHDNDMTIDPAGRTVTGIVGLTSAINDTSNVWTANTYRLPNLTAAWFVHGTAMARTAWQAVPEDATGTFLLAGLALSGTSNGAATATASLTVAAASTARYRATYGPTYSSGGGTINPADPGQPPLPTPPLPTSRIAVMLRGPDRLRKALIDDVLHLEVVLRHGDVSTWTLQLNADSQAVAALYAALAADVFTHAGIEVIRNGIVLLSGPVTGFQGMRQVGKRTVILSGSDDTIWLARRQAKPDPADATPPYDTQAYDVRTGVASTVMRAYVNANAGPGATTGRPVDGLALAPDPLLGGTVTGQGRFQPVLELLQGLAISGGDLGFRILGTGGGVLQFQVTQPVDRTAAVKFSDGLGNLGDYSYKISAPSGNYAYGGGSGEGTARTFVEAADTASVATWGRIEFFRDRRDTADTAQIAQSLSEELAKQAEQRAIEVTAIDTPQVAFGTHYNLGDRVTAIVDGLTVAEVVRQVTITHSAEGTTIKPTLGTPGNAPPNIPIIFGASARLRSRLVNLERR
jgi:hypothetical protein